jgi:hypothetical protein
MWKAHDELTPYPGGPKCCIRFLCDVFNVSRNFLYYQATTGTKTVTNHSRSVANVSVMAWFNSLLPIADKMPDTEWYQLSAPDRKTVWEWYRDDCRLFPTILVSCSYAYFTKIWTKHYGKILRLRRFCRFSKCDFCLEKRGIKHNRKLRMGDRMQAQTELLEHYQYISRERELALSKAFQAVKDPAKYLSIVQDGTNQLPFGFPNYREKDKSLGLDRLKTHLMISMVHGRDVFVYVTPEARVASDPNLTIECLQTTLKKVESEQGFLPPILYLQFDNCFRENKNAYMVAYCTWLVERGVFDKIVIGFLPVGHTHNEADQVASCFGLACRHHDVHTLKDLIGLLEKSYTPRPRVEYLDATANVKLMMNPDGQHHYGSTSKIRQTTNVSTPLHFEFIRDGNGRGLVRTKDTVDQEEWSEPYYPLKCENNRVDAPDAPLKLKLTDIPGMAMRVRENEAKLFKKIEETLNDAAWRLTNAENAANLHLLSQLRDAVRSEKLLWDDDGLFACEMGAKIDDDERQELLEVRPPMCLRQRAQLHKDYHTFRRAELAEVRQVSIGRMVGWHVHWDINTPLNEQQPFWIGKVISVDDQAKTVKVHYYHTGTKRSGDWMRATYRPWAQTGKHLVIHFDDIIDVWDSLNESGSIPVANRKFLIESAGRGPLPRTIDELDDELNSGMDDDDSSSVSYRNRKPPRKEKPKPKKKKKKKSKSKSKSKPKPKPKPKRKPKHKSSQSSKKKARRGASVNAETRRTRSSSSSSSSSVTCTRPA